MGMGKNQSINQSMLHTMVSYVIYGRDGNYIKSHVHVGNVYDVKRWECEWY